MESQSNQWHAVRGNQVPVHRPGIQSKTERLQRRLRRAFRVLAVAVFLAASCFAWLVASSWMRSEGAVSVVQAQMEAIRAGEVERAYALFSSEYQAGMSLPRYRSWLRRRVRLAKAQNLQFWGRSVWGEQAALWGSFQDDLGHEYPVRYLLVRESGTWRISSFQVSPEIRESFRARIRFLYI